ncbi:MAG TPA: ABC transporter substrate-binding protein, partial [Trueperaceae bacterium]
MRKRLSRLAALLLILGVTLASAQQTHYMKASDVLFDEIGTPGGTYTLSLTSSPQCFLYYGCIDSSAYTVIENMFDPLVDVNPVTYEIEPALAESWDILEDENAVVFHLRPGVTWHDGVPFTADDVIFSFENVIMNENARGNETARFILDGKPITWEKIDDLTVRANLPVPYGAFLRVVTNALILPKHKLADKVATLNPDLEPGAINKAWTTGTPLSEIVGTGPFMLSEFVPDQKITLKKNPNYWQTDPAGNPLPYVDELEYLIVPSSEVQVAQFVAGQIDALTISGAQYPDLKGQEVAGADFRVMRGKALFGSPPHWAFNWDTDDETLAKVFRQDEFRHAMAYVLDRQRIINDVYNTLASEPGTPVAPTSSFYNPEVSQYFVEQDLDKAAAMLDELGYTDTDGDGIRNIDANHELEFNISTYVESTVYPPIAT